AGKELNARARVPDAAQHAMLRCSDRPHLATSTWPAQRCTAKQRCTASGTLSGEIQMALARARRSESGFNYWPGFVDALSTLVLSIVFLLSVFLVVQFFLSQEVTGKDKALDELNQKIAQLNELLSVEKL